ncbi:LysR family transcriptional regulator [Parasphingopyxis sp.]|uniref:LysR family transcriptional regulator n=1 Tax=Parasphingopyxis sp. TaxID=1920299 RepID=UPI0026111503|nr:LysR family transcriptional regulator [Parasphingopyxis sp.]
MELKWLEDFICVAEKGHFAQAAESRLVTQSALSRRIQSLELWIGASLFDRSEHPIRLTTAGEEFIKTAREIVDQSYEARAFANKYSRMGDDSITISCLHTLALRFIPELINTLQQKTRPFSTSIIAETRTVEEYLTALSIGTCDFFICYDHPSISFDIDPVQYPSIEIASHHIRPYQSLDREPIDLNDSSGDAIPHIEYAGTSFMSRVFEQLFRKAPFKKRLRVVYRASLAESMLAAAQKGFGVAWLPETVVPVDPAELGLRLVSEESSTLLSIRAYRSMSNSSQLVGEIWEALTEM